MTEEDAHLTPAAFPTFILKNEIIKKQFGIMEKRRRQKKLFTNKTEENSIFRHVKQDL
jgi:hypothetical protein